MDDCTILLLGQLICVWFSAKSCKLCHSHARFIVVVGFLSFCLNMYIMIKVFFPFTVSLKCQRRRLRFFSGQRQEAWCNLIWFDDWGWWILQAKITSLLSDSQTCKDAFFFLSYRHNWTFLCVVWVRKQGQSERKKKHKIKKKMSTWEKNTVVKNSEREFQHI